MRRMTRLILAAAMAAACVAPASAQRRLYDVSEMNFDLWCQQEAGLPPERCDKRTDQDNAAFEAYRDKVEAYEIPHLQDRDRNIIIERDIIRGDPVDNPIDKDIGQQSQSPTQITTTTPPRP